MSGDTAGRLLLWVPGQSRWRTLTRRGTATTPPRSSGPWQPVTAVAMDRAGTLGAAVRDEGVVVLWDLAQGRRLLRLPRAIGEGHVRTVAVSGDGRFVAKGFQHGKIEVWEVDGPRCVATLRGHTGAITSLALSRDGHRALSASFGDVSQEGDGTVRSWDVARESCDGTLVGPVRGTLPGRPAHASSMDVGAVSPDARYAVVAWEQGPLTVWDARRCAVVSELPHSWWKVRLMAVASVGPTVLMYGGARIEAWDASTGRWLRTLDRELPPDAHWLAAAAVSADGRVAVLGAKDSGIVAVRSLPGAGYQAPWCYARPRPAPELTRAEDVFGELMDRANDLAGQGRFPAAAGTLRSAQQVPGFARHPDLWAAWARLGTHGRRSALLSASLLYSYDGHGEFTQPPTLALREDGLIAATGRRTGEVDVWDFATGTRLHTFGRGEGGMAWDIRFAVDGMLLVVLTDAGMLRKLNLETGRERLFTVELGNISAFAVNPAGDRILIGNEMGTLRLRDLPCRPSRRS